MSLLGLQRPPLCIDQVPSGCWVACIAGITYLSHDDLAAFVPNNLRMLALEKPDSDEYRTLWSDYHNNVNAYLRERGWRLAYIGPDVPSGFAMAYGPASRGVDHTVIVYNGKHWHDPYHTREGLLSVDAYEVLIPLILP